MNIANVPARTVSITRYVLEIQNIFSRGFLIKIYVNPYGRDILAAFTFLSIFLIFSFEMNIRSCSLSPLGVVARPNQRQ